MTRQLPTGNWCAEGRAIVLPGAGVVGRWPGLVLVVGGDATAEGGAGSQLLEELLADAGDEGLNPLVILDRVRSLHERDAGVAVAVIAQVEGEYRIFATGGCAVTSAGVQIPLEQVSGNPFVLVPPVRLVASGIPEVAAVGYSQLNLTCGLVPGGGVELVAPPTEDTAESVQEILGASKPGGPPPFEVVMLQSGISRPPLPVVGEESPVDDVQTSGVEVRGIRCSRSHFNNPFSSYCGVCGISMVHLTHELVTGIRPTLGFAVFDDGSGYALDRGYLIGRAPEESGELNALVLTDDENSVSRSHAELRLVEWDVVITDLGSTNGVHVYDESTRQWARLEPYVPVKLEPGARLAIGRRQFVFEAAHRL